jgi:hypothetical protein
MKDAHVLDGSRARMLSLESVTRVEGLVRRVKDLMIWGR